MNWKNIVTVYLKELQDSLRDRRTLISMIVVPTLLMPVIMFGVGTIMSKVMKKAQDELAHIAQNLPQLLGETGGHMQAAGEGAQRASAFLSGEVRDLANNAADLLEASKSQLRGVLKALEGVGHILSNVPLIGDVGKSVSDGLKSLGDVANSLDSVGQKVRGLGDRLSDVGGDLDEMGRSLVGGGASLLGFSGGKASKGSKPKVVKGRANVPTFASRSRPAVKKKAVKKKPVKKKPVKKAVKKKARK